MPMILHGSPIASRYRDALEIRINKENTMTFKKIIAVTASLMSLIALAAVPAFAESTSVKPLQAASFKVGAEQAVSYFTSENGRCHLVVTRAGEPNWDQNGSLTVTRFEASISGGQSTQYEGSVGFTCASDAQFMLINRDIQLAGSGEK
jgi:hypothetical protein